MSYNYCDYGSCLNSTYKNGLCKHHYEREKTTEKFKKSNWYKYCIQKPWEAGLWTGKKIEIGTKYAAATPATIGLPLLIFAIGTIVGFLTELSDNITAIFF